MKLTFDCIFLSKGEAMQKVGFSDFLRKEKKNIVENPLRWALIVTIFGFYSLDYQLRKRFLTRKRRVQQIHEIKFKIFELELNENQVNLCDQLRSMERSHQGVEF